MEARTRSMSSEIETSTTPEIETKAMDVKAEQAVTEAGVEKDLQAEASGGRDTPTTDPTCEEVQRVAAQVPESKNAEPSRESTPTSEGSLDVEDLLRPKDAKARRREHKDIEHILKALNSLSTSEEKLAALCKKYTDLLEEHRVLQNKFKQSQRKLTVIMREKDQLQTEHSKAILAKSKLESLCRELQRHNKVVKEESVARAREEEEKRKEVTAKFQETINDIQQQMNEHYAKNTTLREENIELANKLKNLIEQYELREKHIEKVFKHKDLEQQLVDAKLAQANLQFTEESTRVQQERLLLMEENKECHKKIGLMGDQEKQLRAQVGLYTEKYEDFQQTLAKSNEVFNSFKTEMDKMTKKIKKLEKETSHWRTRWENSNKALVDMAEEKTRSDKEISTLNSKIQKLERLCRALQDERRKNKPQQDSDTTEIPKPPSPASKDDADADNALSSATDGEAAQPTKTPPNSPESRASPETVQTNGEKRNGDAEEEDDKEEQSDTTCPAGSDETETSQSDPDRPSPEIESSSSEITQSEPQPPDTTETNANKEDESSNEVSSSDKEAKPPSDVGDTNEIKQEGPSTSSSTSTADAAEKEGQ